MVQRERAAIELTGGVHECERQADQGRWCARHVPSRIVEASCWHLVGRAGGGGANKAAKKAEGTQKRQGEAQRRGANSLAGFGP